MNAAAVCHWSLTKTELVRRSVPWLSTVIGFHWMIVESRQEHRHRCPCPGRSSRCRGCGSRCRTDSCWRSGDRCSCRSRRPCDATPPPRVDRKYDALHEQIGVAALLFVVAHAAERRRPVAEVGAAARAIDEQRALDQIPGRCARANEGEVALRPLTLDREVGREHAGVVHRQQILRLALVVQAPQVHDVPGREVGRPAD